MFVTHRDLDGIGRVAHVNGREAIVEQFDSPAQPVAATLQVQLEDLRRRTIEEQTRVFWYDSIGGRWLAGRVVGGGPDEYFVRTPNAAYDARVQESDLRVRWSRRLLDPLGVLLAGGQESPFYRDSRLPVIRALADQRSASASVGALTSSRIQLHAHQVDVALRILSDPVQRYLLADEVGLGKTIEAGLVVRQLLIENPKAKIVIIAPTALCGQWDHELHSRFFIDDFPGSVIALCGHEKPDRWRQYATADLVVVDEAHHLVAEGDLRDGPYRELKSLALAVPRLLLLSATPVLRREATHLALLHLLDPDVHDLDKIDEFRSRIAMRKDLAAAVFSLDPEFSFLLEEAVERIRVLLPADERFEFLAARVLKQLDAHGDLRSDYCEPDLVASVSGLRAYIAETYRLHRRVIRNRRRAVLDAPLDDAGTAPPFEVTGRSRPRLIAIEGTEAALGREALDEWRRGCRDSLLDASGESKEFAQMLPVLLSRTGGPVADLLDALAWRVERDEPAARRAGLTVQERRLLEGPPLLPADHECLKSLRSQHAADALAELSRRLVPRASRVQRLVVFAGRGQLADALATTLESRISQVHRHTKANGVRGSAEALQAWQGTGGVLICDATADDGLNLQDANAVVHARLPAGPNELEQRIGRVDRYGNTASAEQYVVGDKREISVHGAWLGLLLDGYRVFEESVSAYQDSIDAGLDDVWSRAFTDGVDGLLDSIEPVRSAISLEARDIAQFEALEASYSISRGVRDISAKLSELESRKAYGRSLVRLLAGREGFGFAIRESRGEVRVSSGNRMPFLGADLLNRFRDLAPASLQGRLDRWQALREGGRLLAAGNPLADAVWEVLQIDDRGRATAQWRADRGWTSEPLPYFGFDYLLQADLAPVTAVVANEPDIDPAALRRRADWVFEPVYRRIWLSGDTLTPVTDDRTLSWLQAPYRRDDSDVNLNGDRIEALHHLFGGQTQFAAATRDAEAAAQEELKRSIDLAARTDAAVAALHEERDVLAAQVVARSRATNLLVDDGGAKRDEKLTGALMAGLRVPDLHLMAVTCVVRSALQWKSV